MIPSFEQPYPSAANFNIFQIINFRTYEALPRFRPEDPDPMFMTNLYRRQTNIAWHSRYRTVYPHSVQYRMLRAITLDDVDQLAAVLRERGVAIDGEIEGKYGLTALQYAAVKNKFPIIELLLMHGANINKPDRQGNTPLMLAVTNHSLQSIHSLLKNGCNRTLPNAYGITPHQRALQEQSQYIADFIDRYPKVGRKFPKFRVRLDIQRLIADPIGGFLGRWGLLTGKVVKYPFNNFKGEYKIILNNFKSIEVFVNGLTNQKQQHSQPQPQK